MSRNINVGTIVRWALVIIALSFLVAVFVWNAVSKPADEKRVVWNENMALGSTDAENHFIEYTDSMCPYCAYFALALHSGMADFQRDYLGTGKIYFEVRIIDAISDHNVNSTRGNQASYCAAESGKFWPFYSSLQEYLKTTFYDKGIANKKGAPEMPHIEDQVYYDLAVNSGIGADQMKTCLESGETASELASATNNARAVLPSGVPYFVFNNYKSSGFEGNYNTIQKMFSAGGATLD